MYGCLAVVTLSCGAALMTESVERVVIEGLAQELAQAWLDNYAPGVEAFIANEAKRAEIIARAEELGIREVVYGRANDIFHGR